MTRVVAIAVLAFVVGTALATVPYNENDACLDSGAQEGDSFGGGSSVWPLRTRCTITSPNGIVRTTETGPTVPAALLWIVAMAALYAAAAARRSPALLGAVRTSWALAFAVALYSLGGNPLFAAMVGLSLGVPLVTLTTLRDGSNPVAAFVGTALALPLGAMVWLVGYAVLSVAVTLLAGAGVSAGVERLVRRYGQRLTLT